MGKSFNLVVRMGNVFKVNRVIRSMEDADRAIEAVRVKLDSLATVNRGDLTWHYGDLRFKRHYFAYEWDEAVCTEVVELLEKDISLHREWIVLGNKPHLMSVEAAEHDTAPESTPVPAPPATEDRDFKIFDDIQDHAGKVWEETEELLTICHLFQQSVLRSQEWYEDKPPVRFVLKPVLDTHEMLERRIRKLRDHGKAICKGCEYTCKMV